MTLIPLAVFWLMVIWGMRRKSQSLHLYILFATIPLGAFAVIPLVATAGLTITGPPVVVSFMLVKSMLRAGALNNYFSWAMHVNKLGLLFFFWLTAFLVTVIAPRYFENRIEIVPMKVSDVGIMRTALLHPTAQNFSQLMYLSVSVGAVFLFSQILHNSVLRQSSVNAVRFGALITVMSGWLDFVSTYIPISPVLDVFRTGGYAMNTEVFIESNKRVVGLAPEASSFGATCIFFLSILYFARMARDVNLRYYKIYDSVLVLLLSVLTYLSMSSSAYVAFGVFVALAGLEWIYRFLLVSRNSILSRGLRTELIFGILIAVVGCVAFVSSDQLRSSVSSRLERLIVNKTDSLSYEERSMWTRVSWNAMWETGGLGCGLGSTRASNKVVAIFSNTGVIGGLLFYSFVFVTLRRGDSADPFDIVLTHAVRWSYFPIFMMQLLAGTTPDFGIDLAWMLAVLSAISFHKPAHNLISTFKNQQEGESGLVLES